MCTVEVFLQVTIVGSNLSLLTAITRFLPNNVNFRVIRVGGNKLTLDDTFTSETSAPFPNFVYSEILVSILPVSTAITPFGHIYRYLRAIRVRADNSRYDDLFTCEKSASYPKLFPNCDFEVKSPLLTAKTLPTIYGYLLVIQVGADNSRYDGLFTCEKGASYTKLCADYDFEVKPTPCPQISFPNIFAGTFG